MIDLKRLKKVTDVLNSEGSILALYTDADTKNAYYLSSILQDGSGTVFYPVKIEDFRNYLKSKLSLQELYKNSETDIVLFKSNREIKTYEKTRFNEMLECGSEYYKNLPKDMKSEKIEKEYGS